MSEYLPEQSDTDNTYLMYLQFYAVVKSSSIYFLLLHTSRLERKQVL